MSVIGHSPLAGASGAAGSGGGSFEGVYVDDLFSTFLYEGNGSTNAINNGIDLSGEGGLVWIKNRQTNNTYHALFDTERGTERYLNTNSTNAEYYYANNGVTSFNSNGFTVKGTSDWWGISNEKICSWTFRKQSKFFDVVTYNGTGSTQNISHSLGSVPGMIIIHCRDGSHDWEVYHRSTGATKSLHINTTDSAATDSTVWNNTTPTSSVFTVGTSSNVNQNGHGYVAYVFAHDEQAFGTNGDEATIKCGSYTGNGSSSGPVIDLGFEPQWLMIKRTSNTDPWQLWDIMRGMATGDQDPYLRPNSTNDEDVFAGVDVLPTGFQLASSTGFQNSSGETYIYMAIRRPHKPPSAGTQVFAAQASRSAADGTPSELTYTSNFPVDLMFNIGRAGNSLNMVAVDRLRGQRAYLSTSQTDSESQSGPWRLDTNAGVYLGGSYGATSDHGGLMFRRAPGVFDVVAYEGNSTQQTSISHNLGVVPEVIIAKVRNGTGNWNMYHKEIGNGLIRLNLNNAAITGYDYWQSSGNVHTATTFDLATLAGANASGSSYVAYLFATLDGISKVGSYTGTGSNIDVNCGFTAGARFVLIKRTDSSGDWYFWDTARGIVSGNDPYLRFNSTAAEVTSTDYIDPYNAGFTVTALAPAALNASGGTYLFLAIA
tara:strand:+ start:19 stop:1986 length:1968 start_codon:yes stop_codon:yes gene_type:complete